MRRHNRAVDDPDQLTALDPAFVRQLRAHGTILGLAQLAIAASIEALAPVPTGLLLIPALALLAWLVLVMPGRRHRRWGYAFTADRLRVVHGWLIQRDTVVPLGRIQHIDVHQGPLMRRWDLAALIVHTAGSHGASVALPGLRLAQAVAMREAIRAHIARELA